MASICLSLTSISTTSTLTSVSMEASTMLPSSSSPYASSSSSTSYRCSLVHMPFTNHRRMGMLRLNNRRAQRQKARMAPDEEKLTRRNPLDFPLEWERPKPGRRPDILPQFSPMKTPLPAPLPCDPPEEEEEEEPEKEEPDKPANQQLFPPFAECFGLKYIFLS